MERDPTKFQALPEDFIVNGKKMKSMEDEDEEPKED